MRSARIRLALRHRFAPDRIPACIELAHDRRHARMPAVLPPLRHLVLAPAFVMRVAAEQRRFGRSRPRFRTMPTTWPVAHHLASRGSTISSIAMHGRRHRRHAVIGDDHQVHAIAQAACLQRVKQAADRCVDLRHRSRISGESGPTHGPSCPALRSTALPGACAAARPATPRPGRHARIGTRAVVRAPVRRPQAGIGACEPGQNIVAVASPSFSAVTQIGSPPFHQRPSPAFAARVFLNPPIAASRMMLCTMPWRSGRTPVTSV